MSLDAAFRCPDLFFPSATEARAPYSVFAFNQLLLMTEPVVKHFLLSDINLDVRIKICGIKGKLPPFPSSSSSLPLASSQEPQELYITAAIYANGMPLGLEQSTTDRPWRQGLNLSEWIRFPVKYRDLPPTSRIVLTVWGVPPPFLPTQLSTLLEGSPSHEAQPLAGTSIPVFSSKGRVKLGRRRLLLWPGREGDGAINSSTPYVSGEMSDADRLEKVMRDYDQKELPTVKWLDKLTVKQIDRLHKQAQAQLGDGLSPHQVALETEVGTGPGRNKDQDKVFLVVEFPPFPHPIVYHQRTCNPGLPLIQPWTVQKRIFVCHDPEMDRENPIEAKYLKLSRHSQDSDKNLKPNIADRKALQRIIASPNTVLSGPDKELLWKFRYHLLDNKYALPKFLRCVDWSDENETKQALQLMLQWSEVDIADALELLSSFFRHQAVRQYAVRQLQRADDEELSCYLLQLVQALRYEQNAATGPLFALLIYRCTTSYNLTNFLHWFLVVEKSDPKAGAIFAELHDKFLELIASTPKGARWLQEIFKQQQLIKQLSALLVKCQNAARKTNLKVERLRAMLQEGGVFAGLRDLPEPVDVPFRPEIKVRGIQGDQCTLFKSARAPMLCAFKCAAPLPSSPSSPSFASFFIDSAGPDPAAASAPSAAPSEPGPTHEPRLYRTIFKVGDDLRQDQLMIQFINLMDSLFKKVKLDLCLTPYRVLATSTEDGFVEYVPDCRTVNDILDKYNRSIFKYLETCNPRPADLQAALTRFVKSTAGYSIITYVLGIGDRHLDNVLVSSRGNLFHIDFGFIFGKDPKPFPPPMKFCKEMIEAMGGAESSHYRDFRKYCILAFNILRKNAKLILNLLNLMRDANIEGLHGQNTDADKQLLKVKGMFRLDLGEEEADAYILSLIDDSVNAMFPQFLEQRLSSASEPNRLGFPVALGLAAGAEPSGMVANVLVLELDEAGEDLGATRGDAGTEGIIGVDGVSVAVLAAEDVEGWLERWSLELPSTSQQDIGREIF
eukprot:g58755.t1